MLKVPTWQLERDLNLQPSGCKAPNLLDKIRDKEGGVKITGTRINNLMFADDIDLIEENAQRLAETTRALNEEGKRYGST